MPPQKTTSQSGKSLISSTMVGYCVTVIVATVIAMALIVAKEPLYALVGFLVPCGVYFAYLATILRHLRRHPEAAMPVEAGAAPSGLGSKPQA